MNTPILFLVFNRLNEAKRVFEKIKQIKPQKLYIASDGPRETVLGESRVVEEIRDCLLSSIDWPCQTYTLFRDRNVGCKYAVSSAIDWFFEHEEMGIILEDDCMPGLSFFYFCEQMLIKYKNDEQVGSITGTSYLLNENVSDTVYFHSKFMNIWGWATWRRSWKGYDVEMKLWREEASKLIPYEYIEWDGNIAKKYAMCFDAILYENLDTWDYQWVFHCMKSNFYCITPCNNLITNIGVNGVREFTQNPFINMPAKPIGNHTFESVSVAESQIIDRRAFYNYYYRFVKFKRLKKVPGFRKIFKFLRFIQKKMMT